MALPAEQHIYSVSELSRDVSALLESAFPALWIEGEISNFSSPSSGHWYFTLKDNQAQVRCAMFRPRVRAVRFQPEPGKHVTVRAKVSLYEPRGDFQLIVEEMEEAGAGALQRALEELKKKLSAEGLFEAARKKPLPLFARTIGVITSPTGAALRDILSVLKRRFPSIPVLIYPTPVQGQGAGQKIAQAIALANARKECDVLILARGGGSLEDLWSFNEEVVARAIAACEIPLVCGVGHETDFSLADFVADRRAPTPSVAAEMVSPNGEEWIAQFAGQERRLIALMRSALNQASGRLKNLGPRLQHPSRRLQMWTQRLDELERRLLQAWRTAQVQRTHRLATLAGRVRANAPENRLAKYRTQLSYLAVRLNQVETAQIDRHRNRLFLAIRGLETVSPLATLQRGYAIVADQDGHVIRSASQVFLGQDVDIRVGLGRIAARVVKADIEPI